MEMGITVSVSPRDVLVRATVAVMKDHDQEQLEEEGKGLFGFHCQTLII